MPTRETPDPGFWRMKDGTQIALKDMSDSHLSNALRLQQRAAVSQLALDNVEMLSFPAPTGDMASDAFDAACREIQEEDWNNRLSPCFEEMRKEAERRGLDWEPHSDDYLSKLQRSHELRFMWELGILGGKGGDDD